jgi:glycosyltransferase involved in cell wall biosynthesis
MRILYVTTSLPYGPGEAFIIPEIKALLRRGHEVRIAPRSPRGPVVHGDAAPLVPLTVRQPLASGAVLRAALAEAGRHTGRAAAALGALGASRSPLVRLKNLAVFPKGLWLARLARQWHATHIHAHWAAATASVALVASAVSGIPWSFTAHRFDIVANNLLALKVQKATFARFISQSGMEMARALGIDGLDAKGCVLHMGVDLPTDCPGGAAGTDPMVLLCPANLLPVKGHKYLIDAVALLKERGRRVSLWIAGQGELRERLERQVAEAGLGGEVRFLGQLSHAELLGLYEEGRVGVTVLPSIDLGNGEHEGIPVALIEAMGHGVPVVSTTTGGIPELLEDGAGLLVPPQDECALAEAIERLLDDPRLRADLGCAGRQRVVEEFATEAVVAELLARFETRRSVKLLLP